MTITTSSAGHFRSQAKYELARAIAGKVSRRSGSVTTGIPSPSWLMMTSRCDWLVATVIESQIPASRNCRTTRCAIDSFELSGAVSSLMNCLDRVLLESGHRRLPEPPDNSMICINEVFYVIIFPPGSDCLENLRKRDVSRPPVPFGKSSPVMPLSTHRAVCVAYRWDV